MVLFEKTAKNHGISRFLKKLRKNMDFIKPNSDFVCCIGERARKTTQNKPLQPNLAAGEWKEIYYEENDSRNRNVSVLLGGYIYAARGNDNS